MDLARIAKTRLGVQLAFALARRLPQRTAYALGDRLFGRIARRPDLPFVRGVRANLAVVHDLPVDHRDLDRVVLRLFQHTSRGYIDFVRAASRGGVAVAARCRLSPSLYALLEQAAISERGLVVVGAHSCSFDFMLIALSQWCPDLLVLSQAHPVGSSVLMNDLRRRLGLCLAPISPASLRDALARLRQGGIVGIAADVPVPDGEELTFFGRTACLPTGYARLALSAGTDLIVGICHRAGEGRYEILGERVSPLGSGRDRRQAAHAWAQESLRHLEGLLQRWPDEWLMPEPIWDNASLRGAVPRPLPGAGAEMSRAGLTPNPGQGVSG